MTNETIEELRHYLDRGAYYYSFDPTGDDGIDLLLGAFCRAGKHYHHTDQWNNADDEGPSPVAVIQAAASSAATRHIATADRVKELESLLSSLVTSIELRLDDGATSAWLADVHESICSALDKGLSGFACAARLDEHGNQTARPVSDEPGCPAGDDQSPSATGVTESKWTNAATHLARLTVRQTQAVERLRIDLDRAVFVDFARDESCRTLQSWIDHGIPTEGAYESLARIVRLLGKGAQP